MRASTPAQHLLDTHPLDTALTHLHLARHHPTETAWPHWLRARDLWEPSDQESIENAALFTAAKYYDNGNVNKAVKVLENCLFSDELRLVVSEYNLSIGAIEKIEARVSCCADSVRKFIVLADLKYRIGLYDEAKLYISRLPNDKGMVSGWKNMLVAHISMREYKLDIAKNYYSYAISYFNASKNTGMSLLCESILLRIEDNGDVRRKYSGIVEKSIHFPIQHPTIVLNNAEWLASKYEEQTVEKEYIVNLYDCAISKFDDIGHMTGVASALNSKGAFFHMRRMFSLAGKCYEDSLEFASRASNLRLQTIIRANIAELSNDEREFKKTIDFLKHDSDNILSSVIVSNKLPSQ
ncbi:hypothetical protein [Deinococcus aquaticus]|uniref:hypothetical protein n=1 Tax=Deinococcus aquaticus TaxID=328692 RepID=UPI0036154A45